LGGRNDIRPVKNCTTNLQRFYSRRSGGGSEGNRLTQVHLEKWPLSGSSGTTLHYIRLTAFSQDNLGELAPEGKPFLILLEQGSSINIIF